MTPLTIGWKERVDFPDWDIKGLRVKMDTGARTSALDAENVEVSQGAEGALSVRFTLRLRGPRAKRMLIVEAPVVKSIHVRPTGGLTTARFVIETTIGLGPVTKRILLSISDRQRMISPVILGRQALAGHFVVDVGRKYVLTSL